MQNIFQSFLKVEEKYLYISNKGNHCYNGNPLELVKTKLQ